MTKADNNSLANPQGKQTSKYITIIDKNGKKIKVNTQDNISGAHDAYSSSLIHDQYHDTISVPDTDRAPEDPVAEEIKALGGDIVADTSTTVVDQDTDGSIAGMAGHPGVDEGTA